MKLDGILVEDKKYDFEYNTSTLLPKYYDVSEVSGNVGKTFYGQDYWGYFNGITTNSNFKTLAPESQYSEHPLADRSVNEEAAQACILNKIIGLPI